MSDKAIGVYRVPGDPNPWQQDGPPWLDGWDTVGPAPPPVQRLPMWTERDLGIGQPRPGYYQTVADGLGALLRECGRMHRQGAADLLPPLRLFPELTDRNDWFLTGHASTAPPADGYARPLRWEERRSSDYVLLDSARRLMAVLYIDGAPCHRVYPSPKRTPQHHTTATSALLAIREAFPDAPPCPPEAIREVMGARGEERWQEPLVWDRDGWLVDAGGPDPVIAICDSPAVWCRGLGRAPSIAVAVAHIRWLGYDVPPLPTTLDG